MTISVQEWWLTIQRTDLGEYLMDNPGKKEFERFVRGRLDGQPSTVAPVQPTPQGLKAYADDYAEQVTSDAAADIDKYFRYYHITGATVGGLPTGMSPLGVAAGHVRCSYTALAALGEGLSGWFFEQSGWTPWARPILWPTDIAFVRAGQRQMECALVQVKCTQSTTVRENIKGVMADAAVKHAEHVYWVQELDPHTSWLCHVVGVVAKGNNDFDILHLSLSW